MAAFLGLPNISNATKKACWPPCRLLSSLHPGLVSKMANELNKTMLMLKPLGMIFGSDAGTPQIWSVQDIIKGSISQVRMTFLVLAGRNCQQLESSRHIFSVWHSLRSTEGHFALGLLHQSAISITFLLSVD